MNTYKDLFLAKEDYYSLLLRVKLREIIKYKKLSLNDIADLCNRKSHSSASRWMTIRSKQRGSPSVPELMALCDILKIDIRYFYDEKMSCREADLIL